LQPKLLARLQPNDESRPRQINPERERAADHKVVTLITASHAVADEHS
jgi:hypothetical protein